ncbi:PAS domain-containing sensor histidine kinase, partial [[Clostridium] dakarense]|uniref:PAS domain-containing sensor histidine kinase n=1 Tax=Faecalimicrobium dakarense TaxID=1301100 RepID=UPI0011C8B24F
MGRNKEHFFRDNIEYLKECNIEYVGVYNIILNNEFIGIMTIGYKKGNNPSCNLYDYIKRVCSEIGIIVNNFRLSQEVKKEFDRRVEIENELELFLDTATDLVGIIDEKGNFKKINNQWCETLGWSNEELLSMNYKDIIHKDDYKPSRKSSKRNKDENDIFYVENRVLCKNNEYKWLAWNHLYLEEKKEYITTVRDITEEKKLEEERKNLQEAIHLESIKNEFFANISHEFKTPLNIILGTIQLIDKYIKSGSMQNTEIIDLNKYMRPIKQNSYRLLRLVNNLIDMTRIDTGYYELNTENSNIVSIIEDITMSVTQYIENKGINLIFDTNEEELILACDPDRIERIMLNLISNAIKYTDKNGEIKVCVNCNKDRVQVSVKDNGIGICKDKIDMIFDRFMQVDNSLTRRCEGSGIGLSLVKSLVEMHDGKINVYSEVGKGSEFVFEI